MLEREEGMVISSRRPTDGQLVHQTFTYPTGVYYLTYTLVGYSNKGEGKTADGIPSGTPGLRHDLFHCPAFNLGLESGRKSENHDPSAGGRSEAGGGAGH